MNIKKIEVELHLEGKRHLPGSPKRMNGHYVCCYCLVAEFKPRKALYVLESELGPFYILSCKNHIKKLFEIGRWKPYMSGS